MFRPLKHRVSTIGLILEQEDPDSAAKPLDSDMGNAKCDVCDKPRGKTDDGELFRFCGLCGYDFTDSAKDQREVKEKPGKPKSRWASLVKEIDVLYCFFLFSALSNLQDKSIGRICFDDLAQNGLIHEIQY